MLGLGLFELAAIVALLLVFHERGWKKGFAEGHDKGLKEGFEAGKSHADNWWINTECEIHQERQKIRKEGWP